MTGARSLPGFRKTKLPVRPVLIRAIFLAALLCLGNSVALAAPDCPIAAYAPKATPQITDWYEKYISPSRAIGGLPAGPRLTRAQVEALVELLDAIHLHNISDPLAFEPLVQQIAAHYAKDGDFKGLNSASAEKIYKPETGSKLDFSTLCIDVRRSRFPDDTFAISLFGVNNYNCQRVAGMRGLVFTDTLVNGAAKAECRPNDTYFRSLIIPVSAGTNVITFVCSKDANGCARR
jgi:hypothetical protein